jgi:hypothetical protein
MARFFGFGFFLADAYVSTTRFAERNTGRVCKLVEQYVVLRTGSIVGDLFAKFKKTSEGLLVHLPFECESDNAIKKAEEESRTHNAVE